VTPPAVDTGGNAPARAPVVIGPYRLDGHALLAPMAGVTDLPFRRLCRRLGAALAAGEMIAADERLWNTAESRRRRDHTDEPEPRVVQIAGGDAEAMADAARRNVDAGAQIVDVNMGCPAKKVCNKDAGSALLRDERTVAAILDATVRAVDVPVTLKIRTGPDPANRNAVRIATIAQQAGIAALTVHGRSRSCLFVGPVEYDTIATVKRAVSIPVIANGDIDSPSKARDVLAYTGADALMIGRAAQGRPWIFREIAHFLATGEVLAPPTVVEAREAILEHLDDHYRFYGEAMGVLTARKHLRWYTRDLAGGDDAKDSFNTAETAATQVAAVLRFFGDLAAHGERLVYGSGNGTVGAQRRHGAEKQRAATPWAGEALAA